MITDDITDLGSVVCIGGEPYFRLPEEPDRVLQIALLTEKWYDSVEKIAADGHRVDSRLVSRARHLSRHIKWYLSRGERADFFLFVAMGQGIHDHQLFRVPDGRAEELVDDIECEEIRYLPRLVEPLAPHSSLDLVETLYILRHARHKVEAPLLLQEVRAKRAFHYFQRELEDVRRRSKFYKEKNGFVPVNLDRAENSILAIMMKIMAELQFINSARRARLEIGSRAVPQEGDGILKLCI